MNGPSIRAFRLLVAISMLSAGLGAASAQTTASAPARPDRHSPLVKEAVLGQLRPPAQAEIEEIAALLRALVDEDAQQRDTALKRLSAGYARMAAWDTAPNRLGLSKEELAKLNKYVDSPQFQAATKQGLQAAVFAREQNLRDQPGYLIALLKETAGADGEAVIHRLEKLTRQRFGGNVAAWEAWWSRQRVWGKFEQLAPEAGKLIRLELAEGFLRLDRAHWASVVAAMDGQEMREQFQAYYKKHSPDDEERVAEWVTNATTGPDFKLIFRNLQLAAESSGGERRGPVEDHIRLTLHDDVFAGELSRQGERVRIVLKERSGPKRRLDVWDNPRGGLRVLLCGGEDGSVLLLRQRAEGGFDFARIGREGPVYLRAPTFPEFCRRHPRLAERELLAPLRRVGVLCPEIPAAASAPAEPIASPAIALPDDPGRAQWKKGVFQEVAGEVGDLVALTVSPKGLALDRQHWRELLRNTSPQRIEEVMKEWEHVLRRETFKGSPEPYRELVQGSALAMRLLQTACIARWGMGGGSGSGMGYPRATMEISVSSALDAEIRINEDAIILSVEENPPPGRRIEVSDDGVGAFSLLVTGNDDGSVLLLLQSANGRLAVAVARAEVFLAACDKSYKDFYRRHRGYVEKHLLSYLAHLGLGTPPSPYSAEVMNAAVLALTGSTQRDRARVRELIAQLDAAEFQKRQEATKLLAAGFPRYRDALEQARNDPSLPAETKQRLAEVFRSAPQGERVQQVIVGMGLTEDVEYLIELLGWAGPADRKAVAQQLSKLTGQRLGEEAQPWREWWSRRGEN